MVGPKNEFEYMHIVACVFMLDVGVKLSPSPSVGFRVGVVSAPSVDAPVEPWGVGGDWVCD